MIPILFEDEDIVVVSKPAGLTTEPTVDPRRENLATLLEKQLATRIYLHHRLDKDTSGVILFSKSKNANKELSPIFQGHLLKKTYWALARGSTPQEFSVKNYLKLIKNPKPSKMKSVPMGGDPAETHFRVLENFKDCTWLECRPITGRTHQIRIHLAEQNFPILGDNLYGGQDSRVPRLMLHAYSLEIPHPMTKKLLKIQAPIPSDFEKILKNVSI